MNTKTADHYNVLLRNAKPVTHTPGGYVDAPQGLRTKIRTIVASYTDEAQRREIIAAAGESRPAHVCFGVDLTEQSEDGVAGYRRAYPLGAARWELARPEIDAAIAAHNAATRAAFETYRLACAQGVAVPPQA